LALLAWRVGASPWQGLRAREGDDEEPRLLEQGPLLAEVDEHVDHDSDYWKDQGEMCMQVKNCFCLRHTLARMNNVCGWCDKTDEPMLGSADGPRSPLICSKWIFSHADCPYLWCAEDWGFGRFFGLVSPLVVFGLAWHFAGGAEEPLRQPQKPQFLLCRVTLAEFSKGLRGNRQRMISAPLQNYFPFAPRLGHLLREIMKSSVLQQSLTHSVRIGFFMSVFYTAVRVSPAFVDKLQYQVLRATLEEFKRFSGALRVSVGFLFSFYALGRVSWWWNVIDICRSMQGRTHDIALILGGHSAVNDCPQARDASKQEKWLEAKWNVYRFLMLSWVLCYRPLSADFRLVTFEDLVDVGLLEESEKDILRECAHARKAPLKWASTWISHHVEDEQVRTLMLDKLCALRGTMGALHDACELRAPMSFEGLMYTLVVAWVYTIPFWNLDYLDDRRVVLEHNVTIPTLTAICTAQFYLSMVALLEIFKDPFGVSRDGLSVETIFLETETTTWDYLTAPAADCLEHALCGERFTLPTGDVAGVALGRLSGSLEVEVLHGSARRAP